MEVMTTIYKQTSFESAHLLKGHPKCGKLHGHSYKLEVWVNSPVLVEPYDFVLDFHVISDIAKEYDHSDIVIEQSCEMLAFEIGQKIASHIKEGHVRVRLWETASSWAETIIDKKSE